MTSSRLGSVHARINLSSITILVKNLPLGVGVSQRMIILTNNSLTRNPCLCAELFKNLLKSGYHSLFVVSVVRLINSILQPNLDREDSNVSFKTKVLHFFVLFTCRQVTKSNWINLTDFGPRQNVKVFKPLNPCCDISAQLYFLLIITECILSYWIRADLIVIPGSHSGSNSTLRSLTSIIWSLESLWRRKEQTRWEETV